MIEGTAAMWVQAVTHDRAFDRGLDAPRFRHAFVTLAATRTTWPAPMHFIEAMPRRDQLALTKQHIPADPAKAAAAIGEVSEILRGKTAASEQGSAA